MLLHKQMMIMQLQISFTNAIGKELINVEKILEK